MSEPANSAPAEPVRMTPEVAAHALEFLSRAPIPILAREAEMLLHVRMALEALARGN